MHYLVAVPKPVHSPHELWIAVDRSGCDMSGQGAGGCNYLSVGAHVIHFYPTQGCLRGVGGRGRFVWPTGPDHPDRLSNFQDSIEASCLTSHVATMPLSEQELCMTKR